MSISTYQNFTNTLNTDINVYAGYSIQVFLNSPNWGGGTWESMLMKLTFLLLSLQNQMEMILGYSLCYDDPPINLFSFLGNDADQNGIWSPTFPEVILVHLIHKLMKVILHLYCYWRMLD